MSANYDPRVLTIVRDLIQKTESNEANWAQGRREDQYIYSSSGASVILETQDGDGLAPFRIIITNSSGEMVAEGTIDNGFPQDVLETLYQLSARRFLRVDETLDGLIKEIETGTPF